MLRFELVRSIHSLVMFTLQYVHVHYVADAYNHNLV
jgi:hypothetical protein